MKQTLTIIPLRLTKHNERSNILTALSLELGPVSLLQPAGSGREASRRRAILMPLGLAECVADIRPGRDIHTVGQVRQLHPLPSLRTDMAKSATALLLAEALAMLLRDYQQDARVFRFIHNAIITLDALKPERAANFHIAFLVRLSEFLGIYPDVSSYAPGRIFDMQDAVFRQSAPMHKQWLPAKESRLAADLLRINFRNMHLFGMTRRERGAVLEGVLRFYTLHHAPLSGLRSLSVLQSVFS